MQGNKLLIGLVTALIAFMLLPNPAGAQAVSSTIEKVNGIEYYMHTVEKGQTLYSISKLYQCDINEITAANPGADQGLREGSSIKIPVLKSKLSKTPETKTEYILHEVKRKETLYSIAKQYNIDINELVAANPGSDNGVKNGQQLRIPQKQKSNTQTTPTTAFDTTKPTDTNNYLLHEVERKETLYSIAKHYNVDINQLIAANPGSENGISKGQSLRIPQKQQPTQVTVDQSRTHTVAVGETLYSIANKYGVTIESIQQANGGLSQGLRAGQELHIPGGNPMPAVDKGGTFPDHLSSNQPVSIHGDFIKDIYNIGLLLPFYTNYTDTMESRDNLLQEVALQLYRGALMASDTLAAQGLRANVYALNVIDDSQTLKSAITQPSMQNMDVIIGPTFRDAMDDLAQWNQNKAHIVCPVQLPNKVLLNSPNMTKSVASTTTQWIAIARYIYKKSPNANIVIIDSKNIDDRRSIDAFKEEWKKLSGTELTNIVLVNDASNYTVQDKLQIGKENIVVAPTADKKVVSTLFRVLGDGNIIVYGNENWDNLSVISAANRNKYKVHYPQTTFVDYQSPMVQRWIETYRKRYKSEPNPYAFIGFDLMMYYGSGLQQFGRDFPNHFGEIKVKNLYANGYDYIKTSNESGFENQYVIIVGTEDYTLIREN